MNHLSQSPYLDKNFNCFVLPDRLSYTQKCLRKTEMCLRGRVEASFAKELIFITLTYDDKHVPTTYKRCKDAKIFQKRITRRKYTFVWDDNQYCLDGKLNPNFKLKRVFKKKSERYIWKHKKEYKYKDVASNPCNYDGFKYRFKDTFSEQDFKNAKFRYTSECKLNGTRIAAGLLVQKHLSDFLVCLRNDIRIKYKDSSINLRHLSCGEYGENTQRPHYHILIFSLWLDYDFEAFVQNYWIYGSVYEIDKIMSNSVESVKAVTSYIMTHTVKDDKGNDYQNELSPCFKLYSTYGGGIGSQLCSFEKMFFCPDPYLRSLSFSLSEWDKKSSIKFVVMDEYKNLYEYEIPSYYKKKILKYKKLSTRQFYEKQCLTVRVLITRFCQFFHFKGKFDLLPIYLNLGLLANPAEILQLFLKINAKIFGKNFENYDYCYNFALNYLASLTDADNKKRGKFYAKYKNRAQSRKYQQYLQTHGMMDVT